MKPVDDNPYRYTLTIQLNDDNVGNIIEFSDRPYRIVKMITTKQLLDLWGEGKNSFKAVRPNAMLSASGFDATIVILESMTITEGKLTYTLVQTGSNSTMSRQGPQVKDVVATIDGCWNANDHSKRWQPSKEK